MSTLEPLRLASVHYGSPASFDLLGISSVVEILRDSIKDLAWRGKHEKLMAELERESKEAEIRKLKLESEKALVEITSQKIELLEKAKKLKLSDDERETVIHVLLPQVREIANPSSIRSLGKKTPRLPDTKMTGLT